MNYYIFQKFGGLWPLWLPWLRLCATESLHRCITCHSCLRSTVTCGKVH